MWFWLGLLGCSWAGWGPTPPEEVEASPDEEVPVEAPRRGRDSKKRKREGKSGKGKGRDGSVRQGAHQVVITYRGTKRGAWVHVPKKVAASGKKAPAIVMHHGGHGANSLQAAKMWKDQVEKDFILVFPDGQTQEDKAGWMPVNGELDYNVRFVEKLLDEVAARYPLDEDRVYAAGWSNGAQQTMRLACLASDRFRGFSVVSQTLELDTKEACSQERYTPRPMQFIIGDSDPKNPWEGRGGHPGGASPGRIGIEETIEFFAAKNGCESDGKPRKLPGANVEERTYTCKRGDLRWLLVKGGKHAWPGGKEGVKDLSATEQTVAFFRQQGL